MSTEPAEPDDRPDPGGARTVSVSPLVYRIPAAIVVLLGIYFLRESRQMSVGTLTAPGPGLWPFIVSVVLIISAAAALVMEDGRHFEAFDKGAVLALLGMISLGAFVLIFSRLGMILPGTLLLTFWLRFLSRESWRLSLLVAVGSSLVGYFLFVVALGVVFPDDVVAHLWGGR